MALCNQCGNDYDKAFEVIKDGKTWTFDSFECAIQKLAPRCNTCGCRVLGHGVENNEIIYCCVHCAEMDGVKELKDRH